VRGAAAKGDSDREEVLRDVLKKAGALLSVGDRGLRFELIEDADLYQLQVVDMTDGRVVRKIPPDEILKLIAKFKEQLMCEPQDLLNNQVDVLV